MRLWKSWIIAKKDIRIYRRRKSLVTLTFLLPLVIGIALPLILFHEASTKDIPSSTIVGLLSSFAFFFMIISAVVPLYITSYNLVGEKLEKCLEPLLATPTSDSEILVGKYIASIIPVIVALWVGIFVFYSLIDITEFKYIGYYYFPDTTSLVLIFLGMPLAMLYGIAFGTLASSRATSVQTAYQFGAASLIPFFAIYVLGEVQVISLSGTTNILIISLGLLIATVGIYYLSRNSFNREKILTVWK
jgi:ABC-2 type transport system permease protein